VWDAGSTEYTPDDLYSWGADEVYKAAGKNDGQNRTLQLYHFLTHETDDLLYCVDNDAYHDPIWERRLKYLYRTHSCIINLFNSYDHHITKRGKNFAQTKDVIFRKTCGGISFLINRELLAANFKQLSKGYDWIVPKWDRHVCTSLQSYVAHVDFDGEHSNRQSLKGQIDPGMNPTKFIEESITKIEAALCTPTTHIKEF
jgi:hypothetical protein